MAESLKRSKQLRAPQARGEARRKKLLDVAVALLDERELSEISLADVAKAADIPLGSIYYFHSSVNELLGQVLVRFRDRLADEIAQPFAIGPNDQWTAVVGEIIDRVVSMSREHRAYTQVALNRRAPIEVRYDSGQKTGWDFVPIVIEALRRHFVIGEIPNLERAILSFLDIIDILFIRSVEENGFIDDSTLKESKRAGISYLRLYLPEYLPRQPLVAVGATRATTE